MYNNVYGISRNIRDMYVKSFTYSISSNIINIRYWISLSYWKLYKVNYWNENSKGRENRRKDLAQLADSKNEITQLLNKGIAGQTCQLSKAESIGHRDSWMLNSFCQNLNSAAMFQFRHWHLRKLDEDKNRRINWLKNELLKKSHRIKSKKSKDRQEQESQTLSKKNYEQFKIQTNSYEHFHRNKSIKKVIRNFRVF